MIDLALAMAEQSKSILCSRTLGGMPATPSLSLEGRAEYLEDESAVDEEVQDRVLDGCGRGKHSTSVKLILEDIELQSE